MKKLTAEEFSDRMMALQRARHIFIETGLTNNITVAFQVYQEVFAEREREIFISTFNAMKMLTPMDRYERPECPDCGAPMRFRQVPENPEGIRAQLVCSACDTVLSSENDIQWWMENLKVKDEQSSGIPERTETFQQEG